LPIHRRKFTCLNHATVLKGLEEDKAAKEAKRAAKAAKAARAKETAAMGKEDKVCAGNVITQRATHPTTTVLPRRPPGLG
jgi:hypothetical protein